MRGEGEVEGEDYGRRLRVTGKCEVSFSVFIFMSRACYNVLLCIASDCSTRSAIEKSNQKTVRVSDACYNVLSHKDKGLV